MQLFQQDPMMDQLNMQMMMNMSESQKFFPNYPNGMGMPYNMGGGGRRNFPNQNQGGFQGMSPQQGNQGGSRRYQGGNGGGQ